MAEDQDLPEEQPEDSVDLDQEEETSPDWNQQRRSQPGSTEEEKILSIGS